MFFFGFFPGLLLQKKNKEEPIEALIRGREVLAQRVPHAIRRGER